MFDCASLDMCRRYASDKFDPEQRAAHCCALPDFDTNAWTASDIRFEHMGADPNYAAESMDSAWQHPPEPIEDACPGSWYRCEFVRSLAKYRRQQDANGGRVDNHAYRNVTDEFVWSCLSLWESLEAAAESHRLRVIHG